MTNLREGQVSILKETPILGKESVPVLDALNRILAMDVAAVEDLPGADISAVDGYALCHENLKGASYRSPIAINIIAESSAGNPCDRRVTPGTAVRIMTGALVPKGADTIIRIEHTLEKEDRVFCLNQPGPSQGIRFQGESFKKGDVVITSGGTSKGRYDLTHKAFEFLGVKIKFSNQAQKKGKPTLFGTRGDQLFFALPGNPYAAMLSFDQFVKPVLLKMMGHPDVFQAFARLNGNFSKVVDGHNGKTSPLWAPSVLLGKRVTQKPALMGVLWRNS